VESIHIVWETNPFAVFGILIKGVVQQGEFTCRFFVILISIQVPAGLPHGPNHGKEKNQQAEEDGEAMFHVRGFA
jgi:hypothetical protein